MKAGVWQFWSKKLALDVADGRNCPLELVDIAKDKPLVQRAAMASLFARLEKLVETKPLRNRPAEQGHRLSAADRTARR